MDLLGSLMLSCTEHDGRVTVRPFGGQEELFRVDVPRVIEPLSKRCPPLAPLQPLLEERESTSEARWWNAVAVIDDTLKSQR